ncbi:MAG TPA: hypothetical protein VK452_05245 [Dissulfurispiraceae bacterium]|nr:hypothetical protein [Dissulfurispiraceae bacterium]
MKGQIFIDIICKRFCRYFKNGKEEMYCGGYRVLVENFTASELQQLADMVCETNDIKNHIPAYDENLFNLVCKSCDFRIDGCDYRDNRSGPPCGGYIMIDQLVKG